MFHLPGSHMLAFDPHTVDPSMARAMSMTHPSGSTHHHHLPMMQMDISETDKEYRFSVDLPGIKKENIDITIDDEILTISAERVTEVEEDNMNWHVKERRFGKSSRSVRLPKKADTDQVRAQFADGVLRICVDKKTDKGPMSAKSVRIDDHDYRFAK